MEQLNYIQPEESELLDLEISISVDGNTEASLVFEDDVRHSLGGRAISEQLLMPPDGWVTRRDISARFSVSGKRVSSLVDEYRDEHPDWFNSYGVVDKHGRLCRSAEYFDPALMECLTMKLPTYESAPMGWVNINSFAKNNGIAFKLAEKLLTRAAGELNFEPTTLLNEKNQPSPHFDFDTATRALHYLENEYSSPPAGWLTKAGIGDEYGASYDFVSKVIENAVIRYPDQVGLFRNPRGVSTEFYGEDIQAEIRELLARHDTPPEGWMNASMLAAEFTIQHEAAKKLMARYREATEDNVQEFRTQSGVFEFASPAIADFIMNEHEKLGLRETPPDGWMAMSELENHFGRMDQFLKPRIAVYIADHPEWRRLYRGRAFTRSIQHYSPELIHILGDELSKLEDSQEGWRVKGELCTDLGVSDNFISRAALPYRAVHPEWFRTFIHVKSGRPLEHFAPELVQLIAEENLTRVDAPDGWQTSFSLSQELGIAQRTLQNLVNPHRETHPEWFATYAALTKQTREHYHPDLISAVREEIAEVGDAPDGWLSLKQLACELGLAKGTIQLFMNKRQELFYGMTGTYKAYNAETGRVMHGKKQIFYSGDVVSVFREHYIPRGKGADDTELKESMENWLQGDETNKSRRDLNDLIGLFGAAAVTDILYRLHPEYKKLPLPYVKSKLADYLGDFMQTNPEFSLSTLEQGIAFLDNPSLKESLMEVIKIDCLRLLNKLSRVDSNVDYQGEVTSYIEYIREKSTDFSTDELEGVLAEVQVYYDLLLEEKNHKPDRFVDQLYEGRMFPDINQRINVQEVALKQRVLIADEMGTGKSASAIMAKEMLTQKQALIVVPSNVISVWQDYLSDNVDEDGQQKGYFKQGQAPRVLIIESLEDVQRADTEEFDYVIVSQERLTDEYTDALDRLGFGMLIVDEAHKLKNISNGKRSQNLVRLAEHIEADSEYLILLSGTPVPNKVGDVAFTLKMLYPERFAGVDNRRLTKQIIDGDLLDIRGLLVSRMQMKSLAENIQMPELKSISHGIKLSEKEQAVYELLLDEDELSASEKMALLRRFTLNPRMLDATPDIVGAKSQKAGELLRSEFLEHDKVVMFVNGYIEGVIRGETTILPDLALPENVTVETIDGSTSKEDRIRIQRELRESSDKLLLLVSGQTADTGVDFSSADAVYHFNEPWSTYDKQQQVSRVYRPGLSHDLEAHTLIVDGTIDQGIHEYISAKYRAIEKVLRGVPISDIEKNMLKQAEKTADPSVEVDADLAHYYFSSQDMMAKIYGYVKESGEESFRRFLEKHDVHYAESYANQVGSRSYQANVGRLSGGVIKEMIDRRGQKGENITIADFASGPEMLRRHIDDDLADSVVSLDINDKHFGNAQGRTMIGSMIHSPLEDASVDYLNLSLALHYTALQSSKGQYERVEAFQEMNRVLKTGGRVTISLPYSLGLEGGSAFAGTMEALGFCIVDEFTGQAAYGKNFQTQLITLEKVTSLDSNYDASTTLSGENLKALKFRRTDVSLSDSRKMVTSVRLGDKSFSVHFNEKDSRVHEEERQIVDNMEQLRQTYSGVENIPREEVVRHGLSRVFNGKRYVLFTQLTSDLGSVAIR